MGGVMPTLMMTVPQTDDALYLKYATQSDRQPVRLRLDLETGELDCYAWAEVGPGRTARAHNGVDIEWEIPPLRQDAVQRMYARIDKDVNIILRGAEVDWDGRNWVGKLSDEADLARERIADYVESGWEASDCWEPWDAADYFEPVGLRDIGLSAHSTEEDIQRVAEHEVGVAEVVLDEDDVLRYLTQMVEDAREELEDEESC